VLISNCVQSEDGSLDFDFHVDAEEAAFLMDFAIKSLIHNGIIKVTSEVEQSLQLDLFPATEVGMQ
jgi:hypothetical protein